MLKAQLDTAAYRTLATQIQKKYAPDKTGYLFQYSNKRRFGNVREHK